MKLSNILKRIMAVFFSACFFMVPLSAATEILGLQTKSPSISDASIISDLTTLTDQDEVLINQRFKDFLDENNDYSEDILRIKRTYLKRPGTKVRDLGFHYGSDKSVEAQGVLLAQFREGESELIAFGVKNRQGKRRITLLEWLAGAELEVEGTLPITLVSGNTWNTLELESYEEVQLFLEWKSESLILCHFAFLLDEESMKATEALGRRQLVEMWISREQVNRNYITDLFFPKKGELRPWEKGYLQWKTKIKLHDIRNIDGIRELILSGNPLPVTAHLMVSGSIYALPDWLERSNPDSP